MAGRSIVGGQHPGHEWKRQERSGENFRVAPVTGTQIAMALITLGHIPQGQIAMDPTASGPVTQRRPGGKPARAVAATRADANGGWPGWRQRDQPAHASRRIPRRQAGHRPGNCEGPAIPGLAQRVRQVVQHRRGTGSHR